MREVPGQGQSSIEDMCGGRQRREAFASHYLFRRQRGVVPQVLQYLARLRRVQHGMLAGKMMRAMCNVHICRFHFFATRNFGINKF